MSETDPSSSAPMVEVTDSASGRVRRVDAEFLRSHHRCIYGAGCQGIGEVPAPEAGLGCCSVGAELVDDDDVQTVVSSFVRLSPSTMQHHDTARRDGFLRTTPTGTTATRIVDGACIFSNRPGFGAGAGCALHLGAIADGDRPLDRKPNVCWQLPLRVDETADGSGRTTTLLRRWRRDDWGGPLGWWCTEAETAPEAFTADEPVAIAMRDELIGIVGAEVYDRMVSAVGLDPGDGGSADTSVPNGESV